MKFRYNTDDSVTISEMSYTELQDLSHMLGMYIFYAPEEDLTDGEEDLQRVCKAGADAILALRAKIQQEEN